MRKPPFRTMLLGHPLVATPLTLGGGAGLLVSLFAGGDGNDRLIPAFICGAVGLTALRANKQADQYRAWKAEWDAMGDGPEPRAVRPARVLGAVLVAGLIAALLLAYQHAYTLIGDAAYALGWTVARPWLIAGLVAAIVGLRIVRRWARRAKAPRPVTVVAKPLLRTPSLADAYRALPPYCQALLRGQA